MSARRHERDARRRVTWRTLRRSLIALIGAGALALGPGALAAYAVDEGADQAVAGQAAGTDAGNATPEAAPAAAPATDAPAKTEPELAPAAEPAPEPVPEPEPAAPVEPAASAEEAPAPADEPAAPATDNADDAGTDAATPATRSSAARTAAPAETQTQVPATAKTGGGGNDANITFCHWRGQEKGWAKLLTSNANSIISQGHTSHQGNRDIIPPFTVKQGHETLTYPGLNWDAAGQAILANGCQELPPEVEPPAMVLSATPECIDADVTTQEMLAVLVSKVQGRAGVSIEVNGPNGFTKTLNNLGDGVTSFALGSPGEYGLILKLAGEPVSSMELTFEACEEEPPVYVGETQVCHFNSDEAGWEKRTVTGEEFAGGYATANPRSIFNDFTFTVDGEEVTVVGQNWDADGQAIFENDCNEVPPVVDPPAMVLSAAPECIDAEVSTQEVLAVLVSKVNSRAGVSIEATGPNGFTKSLTGLGDGTTTFTLGDSGEYHLTLMLGDEVVSSLDVTIELCDEEPPAEADPTTVTLQCVVGTVRSGSSGAFQLTGLAEGENYIALVRDSNGTPIPAMVGPVVGGQATATLAILGNATGDFTLELIAEGDEEATMSTAFTFTGCEIKDVDPEEEEYEDPTIGIGAVCFSEDAESVLEVSLAKLINANEYNFTVTRTGDEPVLTTFVADGKTATRNVPLTAAGTYTVVLQNQELPGIVISADATVAACDTEPPVEPPVDPPTKPVPVTPVVKVTHPTPKTQVTTPPATLAVTGGEAGTMWAAVAGAVALIGGITVLAGYRSKGNDYRPHGRR